MRDHLIAGSIVLGGCGLVSLIIVWPPLIIVILVFVMLFIMHMLIVDSIRDARYKRGKGF